MADERHGGRLLVSRSLLAELLHLPEDWRVHRVRISDEHFDDTIVVIVEGAELPVVRGYEIAPLIIPSLRKEADGSVSFDWSVAGVAPALAIAEG